MKLSLDGAWTLHYFDCAERIADLAELEGKPSVPAVVPGNVELDLQRAGILPEDLFMGDNLQAIRRYELYDWCYTRTFAGSDLPADERVFLVFDAVDCFADYYLNGEKIGSSDNMFIEQRFEITGKVKAENTLHVYIKSPIEQGMQYPIEPSHACQTYQYEALHVRKNCANYGWDIFCRAVSAGIWRTCYVETQKRNRIEDIFFQTRRVSQWYADVSVFFNFDVEPKYFRLCDENGEYHKMQCELEWRYGDSREVKRFECNSSRGRAGVGISNPHLWWPNGYGEAAVYTVTARLYGGDGTLLDTKDFRVGLRTVELDMTKRSGKDGKFLIKVNNEPIMCKGSNWVPLDPFHSRDHEHMQAALDLFSESRSNIVRCWGGNVYEDHDFFDLCDEKGIMVWQDFGMACGAYPQDAGFCEKLRIEAAAVVKKLRQHPSLVLWCGDNECDSGAPGRGLDPNLNVLTRKVLPEVLHIYDPYRPYIPSSPYISEEIWDDYRNGDRDAAPENHLWGPRDYFKSRSYTDSKVHFISEMGYHGMNDLESIKKFIPEDHLWLGTDVQTDKYWLYHATCPEYEKSWERYRIKLMFDQAHAYFGKMPDSLEEFIFMSQVSQAEAKKYFIERMRLDKWYTSGIIWWNMLDGWPQFSDAVVDYYGAKKLAFEYIRRVQGKICVMMAEPRSWNCNVVIGSDSMESHDVAWEITDADAGIVVSSGKTNVPANSNKQVGAVRVSTGDQKLFVIRYTYGGVTEYNHYILGTPAFDVETYRRWLAILAETDPKLEKWSKA